MESSKRRKNYHDLVSDVISGLSQTKGKTSSSDELIAEFEGEMNQFKRDILGGDNLEHIYFN